VLNVSPPLSRTFTCGSVNDTLTVSNTGQSQLSWSASPSDPLNVTITPSSHSLNGSASEPVTVSGAPSASFTVTFTDGGLQNVTVSYTCP
jgi:hypothetical protein